MPPGAAPGVPAYYGRIWRFPGPAMLCKGAIYYITGSIHSYCKRAWVELPFVIHYSYIISCQLGNGDRFENLTLRWHQMVHLLVCHDLLLQGLPMLNMDSVGLGKTIEACASIGYIEFGRQYWEKHGQWPGPHFSEHHHLSDNDRRS